VISGGSLSVNSPSRSTAISISSQDPSTSTCLHQLHMRSPGSVLSDAETKARIGRLASVRSTTLSNDTRPSGPGVIVIRMNRRRSGESHR